MYHDHPCVFFSCSRVNNHLSRFKGLGTVLFAVTVSQGQHVTDYMMTLLINFKYLDPFDVVRDSPAAFGKSSGRACGLPSNVTMVLKGFLLAFGDQKDHHLAAMFWKPISICRWHFYGSKKKTTYVNCEVLDTFWKDPKTITVLIISDCSCYHLATNRFF